MLKLAKSTILLLLALALFPTVQAQEQTAQGFSNIETQFFSEAYQFYKKGAYANAVKVLEQMINQISGKGPSENKILGMAYYWKGLNLNKLQEFEPAANSFAQAVSMHAEAEDLYFEYGQALYAQQNFAKAQKAFQISVKKNYLKETCYYYLGYMGQVQEKFHVALAQYNKVTLANPDTYQASNFQISEIMLEQIKDLPKAKDRVEKYVLPQFYKSMEVAPESSLARQIKVRIQEVEKDYDLQPNKMLNGRMLSLKPYDLKFRQSVDSDSNVISEADKAAAKASDKSSLVYNTEVNASYRYAFKRRFILEPRIRSTYTKHDQQEVAAIYKNDAYTIEPAMDLTLEHKLASEMASFQLSSEYEYKAKDVMSNHELATYGNTLKISMKEKFILFGWLGKGDTSIKYTRKNFNAYDKLQDSYSDSITLNQTWPLPHSHLLLGMFLYDSSTLPNNVRDSSENYTFRADYVSPEFFANIKSLIGLSYSLMNVAAQKATRGLEKTYNPSIKFKRNFGSIIEGTLKYEYTKKTSKDETKYAYSKQLFGIEIEAKF